MVDDILSDDVWQKGPEDPVLTSQEVHIWRVNLGLVDSEVQALKGLLSEDEAVRAARFVFEKHRARFIMGRASLRRILSRYVGLPPEGLCFGYGDRGKPFLETGSGGETLRFNLSHSGELALLAVVQGREVGVDVECIRTKVRDEQIVERFFSLAEVNAFRAVPREKQAEAFFNCWTRKEAYIKALGDGLACPLDRFEVSLMPGAPAALLHVEDDPEAASRWFLQALAPGPDYVGAVALRGKGYRVKCWHWTG